MIYSYPKWRHGMKRNNTFSQPPSNLWYPCEFSGEFLAGIFFWGPQLTAKAPPMGRFLRFDFPVGRWCELLISRRVYVFASAGDASLFHLSAASRGMHQLGTQKFQGHFRGNVFTTECQKRWRNHPWNNEVSQEIRRLRSQGDFWHVFCGASPNWERDLKLNSPNPSLGSNRTYLFINYIQFFSWRTNRDSRFQVSGSSLWKHSCEP